MFQNLLQVPAVGKRRFEYLAVQGAAGGPAVREQLRLLSERIIQLPAKPWAEAECEFRAGELSKLANPGDSQLV